MDLLSLGTLLITSNRMSNKLYRRLLPFYMKLPVFWAFIVVSVLGQLLWVVAISHDVRIDLRWSSLRLRLGNWLGFYAGEVDLSAMGSIVHKGFKAGDNLLGSQRG